MFEDNKCPMLESDVVRIYGLSEKFVEKFCNGGCSVECGRFLKELLDKKGMKPVAEERIIEENGAYSQDKEMEGVAVSQAAVSGECFKCSYYKRCSTDETFSFLSDSPCMKRKKKLLERDK